MRATFPRHKQLAEEEVADTKRLLASMEMFRTIRPTMPLQYVTTFLLVALDEGQSVTEYARKLGVSVSVMSRHLLDIGERNRHRKPGFGLVTFRDNPMNMREHEYWLTERGRALIHSIIRALRNK